MMELQTTREITETELSNILTGTAGWVQRIDELHSDGENDSEYVFILWATSMDVADQLFYQLRKNAEAI